MSRVDFGVKKKRFFADKVKSLRDEEYVRWAPI